MKKNILLLIICLSFFDLYAIMESATTQGTEFYFSFNRARPGRDKNMTLTVSSDKTGILKITDAQGVSTTKTILLGSTTISLAYADAYDTNEIVYLSGLTSCYSISTNTADNRGYIVESFELNGTTPLKVSLYAELSGSSTAEAANIYPIEGLGNEYYVLSHLGYQQGGDILSSEALVVATEDNTIIEIIPTCLLDNQSLTDDLQNTTITLNKGQTYQIRALGTRDLTGTIIRTKDDGSFNKCKKIAVFSANQHAFPGDYEYEQLFPTHLWGNEFLVSAPKDGADNVVRIVASQDATKIIVNGNLISTLNKTDYYDYILRQDSTCYIKTSNPTQVAMNTVDYINHSYASGDASMIMITPVQQKLDSITFSAIPSFSAGTNKVSIVASTADTTDITLYELIGSTWIPITLSGWTAVLANSNYSSISSSISATSTYKIIASKEGFNAYLYGYLSGAEYGYSIGSAIRPTFSSFYLNENPSISTNISDTYIIYEKDITFTADLSFSHLNMELDFGDGTKETITNSNNTFTHSYTTVGTYQVKMIVSKITSGCYDTSNLKDTITAIIHIQDKTTNIKEKEITSTLVFPSPMEQEAVIEFNLSTNSNVKAVLMNANGQVINILTNAAYTAGANTIVINNNNYAAGMYFIRLESSNQAIVRKIIIK